MFSGCGVGGDPRTPQNLTSIAPCRVLDVSPSCRPEVPTSMPDSARAFGNTGCQFPVVRCQSPVRGPQCLLHAGNLLDLLWSKVFICIQPPDSVVKTCRS